MKTTYLESVTRGMDKMADRFGVSDAMLKATQVWLETLYDGCVVAASDDVTYVDIRCARDVATSATTTITA